MKTHLLSLKSLLIFALVPITTIAQTGYVFKSPTLLSGTALQAGAVYKYTNVYPSTDALVTIVGFSNGMTITTFDDPSVYIDAFQPVLSCPSSKKSYVEFRINFVQSSNNSIAKVMTEVPMTGIDIDGFTFGTGKIQEFIQCKTPPSYYINYNIGGDLAISLTSGWYQGINLPATFYPSLDTTVRNVMFSMVTSNVSSVSFRLGTDNKSTTVDSRQSSVYFKKFGFTNMLLANSLLTNFSGVANQSKITLNGNFSSTEKLKSIIVERSNTSNGFQPVGEISITDEYRTSFTYSDINTTNNAVYYRLKITTEDNKITYSKVLVLQMKTALSNSELSVFPAAFKNNLTIRVNAEKTSAGVFRIVNYSGVVVYSKVINVTEGQNSIMIDPSVSIPAGLYIATVQTGSTTRSQKIVKL